MPIIAAISYDLVTPPGMHADFREEMKKLNWNFTKSGHDLPNTTCWARFPENETKEGAMKICKAELTSIETKLKLTNARFKLEKYFILCFSEEHSLIQIFP